MNHSPSIPLTEGNYCRLAKAIMLRHDVTYAKAMRLLDELRLHLVCGESIRESPALQSALLTAVNCGKRAFHGGVSVAMPDEVSCLLPWPNRKLLNEIVADLGGVRQTSRLPEAEVLLIGSDVSPGAETDLRVLATGWRGGVTLADEMISPPSGPDFSLGGVLAGGLGVAKAFLRASALSVRAAHFGSGASLWNPSSDWLTADLSEPDLTFLPKQLWLLGLGHLGQAIVWNLGLLPFDDPSAVSIQLQDFDRAVTGNLGAGLLCEPQHAGHRKTRIAADWLEARGLQTSICDRAFDEHTRRQEQEPWVALCGFDSAGSRRSIADAGMDLVVECGLGSQPEDFDSILLHTFPGATKAPRELWPHPETSPPEAPLKLARQFQIEEQCGILGETLAQKAISTSFVGACASAWMLAEVIRGLHNGQRIEILSHHLRSDDACAFTGRKEFYSHRLARNGFVLAKPAVCPARVRLFSELSEVPAKTSIC